MERAPVGSVDLVGAGPGDPGLLTRRGFEALSRADVVVYDHLIHPRLLDLAPPLADRIFAGKRSGRFVMPQEEMNRLLVRLAREGKQVVRLKGGDPFVFGRGAEEAEFLLSEGIPFRVVPGVTAGVGVSAYAGIPVTHRGDSSAVAFITGHDDPTSSDGRLDWSALARFPGTLVIYMGVGRLTSICEVLIQNGRDPETPSALVQSGTLPTQRTVEGTLRTLPKLVQQAQVGPPALVVIGEVLRRRSGLAWFERLPLFGQRIVVTRPSAEMDRSAADLEALGAEVVQAPTIEIRPLEDFETLDDTLRRLSEFDWLVFTSANGVRHLLDRLESVGMDLRALGSVKLAAIGPATASAPGVVPAPGRSGPRVVPFRGACGGPPTPRHRPSGAAGPGGSGPDHPEGRAFRGRPGRAGGRLSERGRRTGARAGSGAVARGDSRLDHAHQLGHDRAASFPVAGGGRKTN